MNTLIQRRRFLRTNLAAALGAASLPHLVPVSVLGQGQTAPNSRIQVGCIGVGPQGRGVMSNFLPQTDCRVIALCDIAKRNLDAALQMVNGHYKDQACAKHHDYRELLRRADLDAVLIATPDHWHVPVAVAAARANKDMYVEKPLGLSVEEDQLLRTVCRQQQRVFQFGTQQRSGREFRHACELVRNGRVFPSDRSMSGLPPAAPADPPSRWRTLRTWTTTGGWARPGKCPTRTARHSTAIRPTPGRPGGSTLTTPSVLWRAGGFIPWTSLIGGTRE